jgi:hypothetical protein
MFAKRSILKRSVMYAAAFAFAFSGIIACKRDASASAAASAPAEAVRKAPAVDRALDDRFAFIAGLPVGQAPYAEWEKEPAWRDFAATAAKASAEFDAEVLTPMRAWAAADLALARERTKTLSYPFGGPDLATAQALFPDAGTVVLLGLEPVGNLPEFGRLSAEGRAEVFADLGALAFDFLRRGYFITMDMMDVYSKREIDGALPVIAFFLKRGGYAVAGLERLAPAADGSWTATPYERLAARPHRPYGVRIDCFKPGEMTLRSIYYFSCDVEDRAFTAGSPLHRFLDGLERPTTFVKAGSYLLHWNNFSTLRRLILDRSLYVLQDDTAVPYRFFVREGWGITLFGRYATPVKDFTNVEQPDLRAAYEGPDAAVRPLPFRFGYRWRTQVDNLMLAERPRRPYKSPVSGGYRGAPA